MKIEFNATGKDRKRLAEAIGALTEYDVKYLGMPTGAYRIGDYFVNRDGDLECEDNTDEEELEQLIEMLAENYGFKVGIQPTMLTIEMPRESFTDEALERLHRIVANKATLIKKALGVDDLTITEEDGKVGFPWFSKDASPDEVGAYTKFVSALCKLAREAKHINGSERNTENEKYTFRCFLLRLGFIGDEYKTDRKILLSQLNGNSAFLNKGGEKE